MIFELRKSIISGVLTLIIGGSGTGKTTFLKYILSIINDDDTRFYSFLGEDSEIRDIIYDNGNMLGEDLEDERCLGNIFKIQSKLKQIKTLIYNNRERIFKYIESKSALMHARLLNCINKIASERNAEIKLEIIVYYIRAALYQLRADPSQCNDIELKALLTASVTRGFKAVIIMDDVTSNLETICKSKTFRPILNNILTRGRHFSLTIIICSHSPNTINDIFRINARNIAWCNTKEYQDSINATKYPKVTLRRDLCNLFKRSHDIAFYNKDKDKVGIVRFTLDMIKLPHKMGCDIAKRPIENKNAKTLDIQDLVKIVLPHNPC